MATKIMLHTVKRWKSWRPELCLACALCLTTKGAKCEVCLNRSISVQIYILIYRSISCWGPDNCLVCISGDLVQSLPGLVLIWLSFSGWSMWDALAEHHIWFHFLQEECSSYALNELCRWTMLERLFKRKHTPYADWCQCRCTLFFFFLHLGTSFKYLKVVGQNWATAYTAAHVMSSSKGSILKIHEMHAPVKPRHLHL